MTASVYALKIDARMVTGTVPVTVAADHSAAVQRIAMVAFATPAIRFMVVRVAFSVHAAVIGHQARVHAVVIHADLVQCAFGVSCAFD